MGDILYWILVGLVAGALGKLIMPGKDPGGIIVTILLGIAGALVGGFIASAIGIGGGGLVIELIIATLGAVLLLFIYRMIRSRAA
ncbi:MAG: GlsB/YeaQ/YmgE family stress response membrane protein [Pacificimonas sp.]|nr:GlsB/YeaQ/YmgE family stress response membrane protein [Pacificimonas sp.]